MVGIDGQAEAAVEAGPVGPACAGGVKKRKSRLFPGGFAQKAQPKGSPKTDTPSWFLFASAGRASVVGTRLGPVRGGTPGYLSVYF